MRRLHAFVLVPALLPLLAAAPGSAISTNAVPTNAVPTNAGQLPAVVPVQQTRAFGDSESADPPNSDADDPAIWVHSTNTQRSVVLGTLKEGGLAVFDLRGRQLQQLAAPPAPGPDAAPGRFNNVDVVTGVKVGDRRRDLALVSDRGRDRVRVYEIDQRGAAAGSRVLRDSTAPETPRVFAASEAEVDDQHTAYGLAGGKDRRDGTPLIAVSQRNESRLALLTTVAGAGDSVSVNHLATVDLSSSFQLPNGQTWSPCTEPGERPQVEGMVIDSDHGVVYAAQEAVGIWRIPVSRHGFGTPVLIDRVRGYGVPATYDEASDECVVDGDDPGFGGRWLTADAEGLTIAGNGRGGRIIASSQGDSTFVVYERTGANQVLGGFTVAAGNGNDSVEHSDGAAVTTVSLGPDYPRGLLVVHDGERRPALTDPNGEEVDTTGFAFVSWEDVAKKVG
ncbi:phytase [Actinopolymorpha alba]|uniref:phytase n=1 Tax=Actinopolymorpha alba TaxID=533267 RepID=UPI00037DE622|nr:phytase [Actinopolymorpha alba]